MVLGGKPGGCGPASMAPPEPGLRELPFQLSGSKSDFPRPEGPAQCGGPQGAAGKSWALLSCGLTEEQVGREGGWYRGVETLWV